MCSVCVWGHSHLEAQELIAITKNSFSLTLIFVDVNNCIERPEKVLAPNQTGIQTSGP